MRRPPPIRKRQKAMASDCTRDQAAINTSGRHLSSCQYTMQGAMGTVRWSFVAIVVVGAVLASGGLSGIAALAQEGQPKAEPQPKAIPKAQPKSEPSPNASTPLKRSEERAEPAPGCGWIGKRVIQSLLRDDAVTAHDFDRLYRTFNCSGEHLRIAFDCTVSGGAPQTANEAQTRLDSCWSDPKSDPRSPKSQLQPASPPASTSGTTPGTGTPQSKGGEAGKAPASGSSTPNYSPSKGKN